MLGEVGYVDFLVDGRLVIEGDGFEFHSNREELPRGPQTWEQARSPGEGAAAAGSTAWVTGADHNRKN